jgi:aminodeoxyfutalosine deaminase
MKILAADYLVTMDDERKIIRNGAVIYDSKILEISFDRELARSKYPEAQYEYMGKNSVIMPSLINAHVHLEFSKNKTTLHYGNFIDWLTSVIEKKELTADTDFEGSMQAAIAQMKKSGVGAIGAVSSFGRDIETLARSGFRVTLFNEALGTSDDRLEEVKADFLRRFEACKRHSSEMFTAAISVHSAYSCSRGLIDFLVSFAKENSLKMSTHFMESKAERFWLDKNRGEFKAFFKTYFGIERSQIRPEDFLSKFKGLNSIFVHCTHANDSELETIRNDDSYVVHCPVSNRLLGMKLLDVETAKNMGIEFITATDGLSSNFSLSLWNELRCALFGYTDLSLKILPYDLLKSVTANAAKALDIDGGKLEAGKNADLIAFCLPGFVEEDEYLPLQIILHTNEVDRLIINGVSIDG